MYSIGDFSRMCGLSVRTLRAYHEKGVLAPTCVDEETGYRYYDGRCLEQARVVRRLREMEFSLQEIREILDNYDDEADILDHIERHKAVTERKIREHRNVALSLDRMIQQEREAQRIMANANFEIEEKKVDAVLIAGVRVRGQYSDCGKGFAKIGKSMGRFISGKPFCLYYDGEYREDDADFEACMPVRSARECEGISMRELPAVRVVCLLHQGPYQEMGRSYEKVLGYVSEKGYEVALPTREVYIKGPGMILKGNPKKYLTEIQIPIQTEQAVE